MSRESITTQKATGSQNAARKLTGKYAIIGSEAQVAATESRSNLNVCRRAFRSAKFSNGCKALVVMTVANKQDAANWLARSNSALAFVSGRLGRWLAPTFVIVPVSELNAR